MRNIKREQFINSRTIAQTQEENQAAELVILRAIERKIKSQKDLLQIQKEVCEELGSTFLTQPMLLNTYRELIKGKRIKANESLFQILRKRRIRTSSGVAPVAILTKPFPCPGKCIYCPSEPNMPKSYISNEPAVMRAILADFDPARQIEIRLRGLEIAGNPADKIELIVMGGTWSALPKDYQLKYIIECYKTCNEFNSRLSLRGGIPIYPEYARGTRQSNDSGQARMTPLRPVELLGASNLDCFDILVMTKKDCHDHSNDLAMTENISNNKLIKQLEKEQTKNEKAKYRIVGLTLETRPDFINEEEIKWMRMLGCTRVELGVQSIYDRVLNKNERGHKVGETIKATKLLKDAGFKICYHMMPNLYGSNKKLDLQMFKDLFNNPNFQPDMIKIYNCVVTKYSALEKLVKSGKFISYTDEELIKLMIDIKSILPEYVRVLRLGRDIPADNIVCGSKMSNIRQIVQEKLKTKNEKLKTKNYGCRCIRCREIREDTKLLVKLKRIDYDASGGKEIFLQYVDDNNRLYALLRLRITSKNILSLREDCNQSPKQSSIYSEIAAPDSNQVRNDNQLYSAFSSLKFCDCALIRELHTYGPMVEVGAKRSSAEQHQGLGKRLIQEAEKIAKEEFGLDSIAVISGVGVRDYYRKLGYILNNTYMTKNL